MILTGFLEDLNLDYKVPPFLDRGQRQFTTKEANRSRVITKTRWIVESRNGHLKSIFKFFRDMIPIQHCSNLGVFLRIACAIINLFYKLILMQNADNALAHRMLQLAQTDNLLQTRVEQERLHLRRGEGMWIEMGQNRLNFPKLPLQYILDKTFGTYQVRLAPAYIQGTLGRDRIREFIFETQLFELRARLYSRYTQARKHTLYKSYNEYPLNNHNQGPDEGPISGTYCTCKAGARTLGVCAHVASVIWFFGYASYEENIPYPGNSLLIKILDSAEREIEIVDNI